MCLLVSFLFFVNVLADMLIVKVVALLVTGIHVRAEKLAFRSSACMSHHRAGTGVNILGM